MSNYPLVSLGDLAQFINGDRGKNYPSKSQFIESGIPFINAGHLTKGEVDFADMNYISEEHFRKIGSGKTMQNDILYCLRGSLGKTAVVTNPGDAAVASSLVIIRATEKCSTRYLFRYLTGSLGEAEIRRFDSGSSQPNLSATNVKKYQIPLPPLAEQKRIAAILDAADALRAKRQQALAHLDDLLQSIFLTLFGDPVTNPMGWEVPKFSNVVESRLGKMLDKGKETGGEQFPYLANYNVRWGEFKLDSMRTMELSEKDQKEFELRNGDVLVCEGGEIGRCAIWRENDTGIYFQKAIHRCRVDPKRMTPEYLQYYFRFMTKNGGMDDFVTSATIAHLTGAKMKQLPLPLPPLPLQQRFAAIVGKIEAQKTRHRAHLAELDTLFASLQSRAFSGEL